MKAKANEEELRALGSALQLSPEWLSAELGPRWYPNRGIGPIPPTDPVIYRLFEVSKSSMVLLFLAYLFSGCVGIRPCHKGKLVLRHCQQHAQLPHGPGCHS